MVTDQSKPAPTQRAGSAASPLADLLRLLARQAAREVITTELDKGRRAVGAAAVAPSAKKQD